MMEVESSGVRGSISSSRMVVELPMGNLKCAYGFSFVDSTRWRERSISLGSLFFVVTFRMMFRLFYIEAMGGLYIDVGDEEVLAVRQASTDVKMMRHGIGTARN